MASVKRPSSPVSSRIGSRHLVKMTSIIGPNYLVSIADSVLYDKMLISAEALRA